MAKLSEILGGILKDVLAARTTADYLSRDLLETYQQDPIMAMMPVPRITIRQLDLSLKFAVAEHTSSRFDEIDETKLKALLVKELKRAAFAPVYKRALTNRNLVPQLGTALKALLEQLPEPDNWKIIEALEGNPKIALKQGVVFILSARSRLPTSLRRNLVPAAQLRAIATKQVQKVLDAELPRLRQVAIANQVSRFDLDILIKKSDLEAVSEAATSELHVTLSLDELQILEPQEEHEAEEG